MTELEPNLKIVEHNVDDKKQTPTQQSTQYIPTENTDDFNFKWQIRQHAKKLRSS